MQNIEQLQQLHFKVRAGDADWRDCVDWAIERLRKDEEGDDLDVVMLAAATLPDEVPPLVQLIAERYLGQGALNEQLGAGKRVVALHRALKDGQETAVSLEPKLWRLYYDLARPDWLMMLARNCEYATDVPDFQKPFEAEFDYIAGLWLQAKTKAEFDALYDASISRSHDVQYK